MANEPRQHRAAPAEPIGVRLAGTGSYLPEQRITNADLEKMMDTSDEWITQRTGIKERRRVNAEKDERTHNVAAAALRAAIADARLEPNDLDLVIVATCTQDMGCPSVSCLVCGELGIERAGAFDLTAACSGFVFALNTAHDLIRGGAYRTIGVVGCDVLTKWMDYSDAGRGTAILFGDGGGAAILKATDDVTKGIVGQAMHSDGSRWTDLYIPERLEDFPEQDEPMESQLNVMQMKGREIFRFAVGTFPRLIEETLEKAGVKPDEVDQYICHQSNARILEAARQRFGLPADKIYVNIDRVGNTSAGSVAICLDELRRAGRVNEGDLVMFVAFGGGLTWGSSLWRL